MKTINQPKSVWTSILLLLTLTLSGPTLNAVSDIEINFTVDEFETSLKQLSDYVYLDKREFFIDSAEKTFESLDIIKPIYNEDGSIRNLRDLQRTSQTVSYTHLTLPTTPYV